MRLDKTALRLSNAGQQVLNRTQQKLSQMAAKLDALSPLKVLSRGYALVQKSGAAVMSAATLIPGDRINLKFADGQADCLVQNIEQRGIKT